MTTYEFEVAAKNAVITFIKEDMNYDLLIQDIDVVWITHVLGYKKCLLMSLKTPYYYEITYNKELDTMYFDVYTKIHHRNITVNNIKRKVNNVNNSEN